jgi:uncharacterized protein YdhG (YjbR/CyaY superfamily)
MARPDYKSVDDYIAAQPLPTRSALKRVRATMRKALPNATEGISYQIPVYKLDGEMVLFFAGYAHHYAIYPATAHVIDALGDKLAGLLHNKATIRFPLDGPVPTQLITRIAKLRAAEAKARKLAGATKRIAAKKALPIAEKKRPRKGTTKRKLARRP